MIDAKVPPGLPKWMQDHVDLYLSSRGAEGHMYTITLPNLPARSVPSMLLVTKGRKSGEKFLFPLFYGKSGNSYYVVASKGGAPEHPGWYRNILVNPEVEIQVGTTHLKARARTSSGEERAQLWKDAAVFWPPYNDYQKKAGDREIPVVVLDPVS